MDTYNWTGPNDFTSEEQNPVINNASLAASGEYTLTATFGTCSSTTTTDVIVSEELIINFDAPSPICEGDSLIIALDNGIHFTWTGPAGYTSTDGTIVIPNAILSNGGTYSVTVSDEAGCTAELEIPIDVNVALFLISAAIALFAKAAI